MKAGNNNTIIGEIDNNTNLGDGNTIINFADVNGNLILNSSMAIGNNAHAGPNSIAIGAGANAGNSLNNIVVLLGELKKIQTNETITRDISELIQSIQDDPTNKQNKISFWKKISMSVDATELVIKIGALILSIYS